MLGIALTDTFGTPAFLKAFRLPAPDFTSSIPGKAAVLPSAAASSNMSETDALSETSLPLHAPIEPRTESDMKRSRTYAEVFTGVRQDSGDPAGFVKMMRAFYDAEGIQVSLAITKIADGG